MNGARVNEINCQQALAMIAECLDKRFDEQQRVEFERHIERCKHCFDRFEFERLLKARLASLKMDVSSESLQKRVEELLQTF